MITIKNTSNNNDLLVTAKKLVKGDKGGHYIPVVDANGVLRWVPSEEGMAAIKEVNVKGPIGETGAPGKDGRDGVDGKNGKSGVHVGSEAPTDEDATVWIDLDGGGIELEPAEGGSY